MHLIVAVALLAYYLLRRRNGLKDFRNILVQFTATTEGKIFITAAMISVIVFVTMILKEKTTFDEIVEIQKRIIELCPFCM